MESVADLVPGFMVTIFCLLAVGTGVHSLYWFLRSLREPTKPPRRAPSRRRSSVDESHK